MTYAAGLLCHDADSHVVEDPGFYLDFADPQTRGKMSDEWPGPMWKAQYESVRGESDQPAFVEKAESELMERKLFRAMGAFDRDDRRRALDLLGFSSQMVFDSFMRASLRDAEKGDDLDYLYGLAQTHNRAIVAFCSADRRLLPVGYLPMADVQRSNEMAREAIEMGCAALQACADCPKDHSPAHIGFEPMWAQLAEAGVPLVYHLAGGRLPSEAFRNNGLPEEPAFHGGDGHLNSIDYVAVPHPLIETVTALIVDGVLHRHPDLRIGMMEFGGCWLPGWMQYLDSAMEAFRRSESRLRNLDLKLSEYVIRQIRCTIFGHENLGWAIAQSSPDIFMFSSDYPHIEGGRNPMRRFNQSMDASGIGKDARESFYRTNFEDFVGGRAPPTAGA
ncbi:MAG: amidohydrolase family protein [Caulobacteraceae bacterium]|nr:amidohydrolase family protein [Caulobacteraceae bacterium]